MLINYIINQQYSKKNYESLNKYWQSIIMICIFCSLEQPLLKTNNLSTGANQFRLTRSDSTVMTCTWSDAQMPHIHVYVTEKERDTLLLNPR